MGAMVLRLVVMENSTTIGQRLIHYRQLKGWPQSQLCVLLGMRQARLSRMERDLEAPSFLEVAEIAAFLNVPLDSFNVLSGPNWL